MLIVSELKTFRGTTVTSALPPIKVGYLIYYIAVYLREYITEVVPPLVNAYSRLIKFAGNKHKIKEL